MGTLRILVALIVDVSGPFHLAELATDLSIFGVFVTLLVMVSRKASFKKVHPLFGVLFIVLMGLNFLEFGGALGTNCFNYYSGIYVIVMLFSGRTLYSLLFIQLSFLASLIYLVFINHPFYQNILLSINDQSSTEFVFSLMSISVFTFYLKRLTLFEIKKSESKAEELNLKVKESKKLNRQLIQQSEELKHAQEILKKEVHQRVVALEKRKAAIEQYIHHNTTTLKNPLLSLSTAVDQLKEDSHLCTLLKLSHAELTSVINSINLALKSEELLNRDILEKNL